MKRRMIITGLCLMLAFSITACGTKGDTAKTATADKNSTKTESAENKKENDNSTETSSEEESNYFEERGLSSGEIYSCRKDLKGWHYDKGLLELVSINLQHSRDSVVIDYLWKGRN